METLEVKNKIKSKQVFSEMIEITPEYAQELLKKNTANRPISQRSVRHYAQQMVKGDWCAETDESVKISITGCILDGQHRLSAIVSANVPVKMKITYNLPNEIFKFIDQGKKRTAQDVMAIAGVPNASLVAGMIKSAIVLSRGTAVGDVSATQAQMSNEDVLIVYNEKPQYWQDVCSKAGHWYRSFHRILKPAFLAGHFHIFRGLNVEAAEQFMERLCTGIGLTENDPVRILRDYFLKQLDLKGKKVNTYQYNSAMMIKGWNAYRQGKQISQLRWDSSREQYPEAI